MALVEYMSNSVTCYAEQSPSDARTLLRKGSFSGLRDTVKSVLFFCLIMFANCLKSLLHLDIFGSPVKL